MDEAKRLMTIRLLALADEMVEALEDGDFETYTELNEELEKIRRMH